MDWDHPQRNEVYLYSTLNIQKKTRILKLLTPLYCPWPFTPKIVMNMFISSCPTGPNMGPFCWPNKVMAVLKKNSLLVTVRYGYTQKKSNIDIPRIAMFTGIPLPFQIINLWLRNALDPFLASPLKGSINFTYWTKKWLYMIYVNDTYITIYTYLHYIHICFT